MLRNQVRGLEPALYSKNATVVAVSANYCARYWKNSGRHIVGHSSLVTSNAGGCFQLGHSLAQSRYLSFSSKLVTFLFSSILVVLVYFTS